MQNGQKTRSIFFSPVLLTNAVIACLVFLLYILFYSSCFTLLNHEHEGRSGRIPLLYLLSFVE